MPAAKRPAKNARKRLEITLPATSANLGPAFDTAALAFRLYLKITAEPATEYSVTARGRDADICSAAKDHLILNTYREVLQDCRKPIVPLALRIDNKIPIGKGCGSSAAARLAGIALAVHFGDLRWDDARIVAEASRREHHPDNAAACWMGGLTIARIAANGEVQFMKFMPKGKWPLLLVVPDQSLSTEQARRVLPAEYSRQDVVSNVQNSMMLLAAFVQGRHDIVSVAQEDRIHQPYRSPLCPLLPAIQEIAGNSGVLAAALSGAGPSVLVFLDPKSSSERILACVRSHLRRHHLSADLIEAAIAGRGARHRIVRRT
jgi:homoserine kinase